MRNNLSKANEDSLLRHQQCWWHQAKDKTWLHIKSKYQSKGKKKRGNAISALNGGTTADVFLLSSLLLLYFLNNQIMDYQWLKRR